MKKLYKDIKACHGPVFSNSCHNTRKFTYIRYSFLRQLFKGGNYPRKYGIDIWFLLGILIQFKDFFDPIVEEDPCYIF